MTEAFAPDHPLPPPSGDQAGARARVPFTSLSLGNGPWRDPADDWLGVESTHPLTWLPTPGEVGAVTGDGGALSC